ncbi:phosphatidylinositol phosphatase PTPRQ-like [Amphiura filiformis]|uniref:phosphatidylinositol phosphatase PTPRQ-like n=1 Tax=Amphiura filiformis TaxID=82378 RepID=UPI003B228AA8
MYRVQLVDENSVDVFGPTNLAQSSKDVNITELEPGNEYTFTISAINIMGEGPRGTFPVTTLPLGPNPPQFVILTGSGTTFLTFSWDAASCGGLEGCNSIVSYSYTTVRISDGVQAKETTSEITVTVNSLQPCTMYDFFVAATSNSGLTGPNSKVVSALTKLTAPSTVRNIARSEGTNPSTLVVRWTEPEGPCAADSYNVKYKLLNKDMCEMIPNEMFTQFGVVLTTNAQISSLEPYSEYMITVSANNSAGFGDDVSGIVTTSEQVPSGSPINVESTSVSTTTASFIWDEVTCGERRGNIIQYHCKIISETDLADNAEMDASNKMILFEGLQPCTTYDFTVAAVTMAGMGPRSTVTSITTGMIEPSSIATLTSPLLSTVRWDPPTAGLCPAEEYLVEYELINKDQCEDVTNSAIIMYGTVTDTETTLTGLLPHSTYRVYVTARNSGGAAASQNIEIQTEEGEPTGSPLTVMITNVGQRHLTFSWTEPECGDRNGDIVMYSYELTNNTNTVITHETSQTTVSISNLTPYVNYSFRIAAVNSAGHGPFSDVVMSQTEEDVPPAPEELGASNTDTDSITIEWLAPDPPHGVIIRYHIQYWKTSESMSTAMSAMNERTAFTLTGLLPTSKYLFRVQAETSAGRGDWSKTVTAEATEGLPSAPFELRATGLGKTSIALEWRKPLYPNGIILDYAIKYQALEKAYDKDFISNNRYTTLPVLTTAANDAHEYLVDDLEPSTKYEFRVSGRTSVGRGEEAVIEVYTKTFTDIEPPKPPVLKTSGPSVIIEFDVLPKYISNVFIAIEYAPGRNKRQNSNLDGASNSIIVANLTRGDIEEGMTFTLGDNKTYGGYINHVLIPDATYTVRVAYASCTPVEECVPVAWSPISIITAPNCKSDGCGETGTNIGATIGGSLVAFVLIIVFITVAIVIYYRRQHSSLQQSPTSNETYDEIDPKIAQQSAIHNEAGYEVNLAMEGMQTPNQHEGDELDYEDVKTKTDSDYQGLNTGDMETEHDYQGLDETEKKKESDYQGLNKANMDEEHTYQDLGQKSDTNRKISSPYVNVP